ncbi:MAG: glycosyltransferase family 2 protein [Bacteroidetes bacterium]|nr:glycosyltransferase family 2 protein [Bacteroidota bacterium]
MQELFVEQKIDSDSEREESLDTKEWPTVSIAIPLYNEEKHVERLLSSFLHSSYPNIVEVLIADGGSVDKTRDIVHKWSEKDPRVTLIENPNKYQSFGLNEMIKQAKGEVFLRADGHCLYANDYVEECIKALKLDKSRNVGGAQRYLAQNAVQTGISLAVKSVLGNGGAKYMKDSYNGFADTVFLGCFWTQDLRDLGGFSEINITNQDSELNLRLLEEYGACIRVSSDIKCWYYPRSSFKSLLKQYFRYGRGRFITLLLHPFSSPLRSFLPTIFLLSYLGYVLADVFTSQQLFSLPVTTFFASLVLLESIRVVIKNKKAFNDTIWKSESKPPNGISKVFNTAASLVVMQIGHSSGFIYQVFKRIFSTKNTW